jgi:hypothetical protein
VESPPFVKRLDDLMETPAAVRFVSLEPLLADVGNLSRWLKRGHTIHVSADVEGMLRNRSFTGLTGDNGQPLSRRDAEDALWELHAKGVKVIKSTDACVGFSDQTGCPGHPHPRLDWVIAGLESNGRPGRAEWIVAIQEQCRAAGVAFFPKQYGSDCRVGYYDRRWRDFYESKGLDWPDPVDWDINHEGQPPTDAIVRLKLRDRKGGDPSEWPADLRVRQFPEPRR